MWSKAQSMLPGKEREWTTDRPHTNLTEILIILHLEWRYTFSKVNDSALCTFHLVILCNPLQSSMFSTLQQYEHVSLHLATAELRLGIDYHLGMCTRSGTPVSYTHLTLPTKA